MTLIAPEIFDLLIGEWSFHRTITGTLGMAGTAIVTRLSDDLAQYTEAGELQLADGKTLHARQRYLFERTETGFAARFAPSGALFHEMHFEAKPHGTWIACASHRCSKDSYRSTYRIRTHDCFEVEHTVLGPRKDYTTATVYLRQDAGEESP